MAGYASFGPTSSKFMIQTLGIEFVPRLGGTGHVHSNQALTKSESIKAVTRFGVYPPSNLDLVHRKRSPPRPDLSHTAGVMGRENSCREMPQVIRRTSIEHQVHRRHSAPPEKSEPVPYNFVVMAASSNRDADIINRRNKSRSPSSKAPRCTDRGVIRQTSQASQRLLRQSPATAKHNLQGSQCQSDKVEVRVASSPTSSPTTFADNVAMSNIAVSYASPFFPEADTYTPRTTMTESTMHWQPTIDPSTRRGSITMPWQSMIVPSSSSGSITMPYHSMIDPSIRSGSSDDGTDPFNLELADESAELISSSFFSMCKRQNLGRSSLGRSPPISEATAEAPTDEGFAPSTAIALGRCSPGRSPRKSEATTEASTDEGFAPFGAIALGRCSLGRSPRISEATTEAPTDGSISNSNSMASLVSPPISPAFASQHRVSVTRDIPAVAHKSRAYEKRMARLYEVLVKKEQHKAWKLTR